MATLVTPAFWKGKRVLLTGHTGFKGSWLALRLADLGARVFGYALAPETTPNAYGALGIANLVDGTLADVRDRETLQRAFGRARPDVVIHMAAQALVRRGYAEPHATFEINVMGTANVLEAIRTNGGGILALVVTSDKTYANAEPKPQREEDTLGGFEPYGASKACAEIVAGAYRAAFFSGGNGARVATARAGNVIGGGDWSPDRLLPDIVRASERREAVRLRYPGAVRPWLFVADALDGYLAVVEALAGDPGVARAWNLGPSEERQTTVLELARAFLAQYDPATGIAVADEPQAGEAAFLALDSRAARDRLGWSPRVGIDPAVAACAEWYATHRSGGDVREVSLRQMRPEREAVVR